MRTGLHVSANQWRVSILKACIGANIPRGIADEIADGCLALLALGRDPLPQLLTALNEPVHDAPGIEWPNDFGAIELGHLQVLQHGPSVVDLVHAGAVPSLQIDAPLLLLGLAQARLYSHGVAVEVSIDHDDWTPVNGMIAENGNVETTSRLSLRAARVDTPVEAKAIDLPQPSRQDWQALQNLAAEILVPADATSREDAGVGDGQTDND